MPSASMARARTPAARSDTPLTGPGARAGRGRGWQNSTMLTLYRITPAGDPGVANMDTADAPGDVYFGQSQLLLPGLEVLYEERDFRRYQSVQFTVFSGAYIIPVLQ